MMSTQLSSLYIILVIVVFLKVLFWIFYLYSRSQRLKANRSQTHHSVIIVETRPRAGQVSTHDRAGIVQNEFPQGHTNPAGPPTFPEPPAYRDCVHQGQVGTDRLYSTFS